MKKANYGVYITEDHGWFRDLLGNRDVTEQRVNYIMSSIKRVGYIPNPIVVNDKREVIDGQARLEALRRLKMPVEYIMVPGIGIEECRAMNVKMKNWDLSDYIKSHVDTGNSNYRYLSNLLKAYPEIGFRACYCAVTGLAKPQTETIKRGEFVCTDEQYNSAVEVLTWLNTVKPHIEAQRSSKTYIYMALIMIYKYCDVDTIRLQKVVLKNLSMFPDVNTVESAIGVIEAYYNKNNRGTLGNFSHEYLVHIKGRGRG